MALEKSGVQLVAENESGFLGAMGRAQKSVQGFEGSIGKATPAISGMSFGSLTLATALGGALVQAASAAVSGFFNLAKSAFAVTAQYETLGVSLQTLLAREIRAAGGATDMGQAFDMAAPAARDLLDWIEQLAIQSPFDQAGVAAAYQTLQVYGFLSLGAKDVAEAQELGVVSAQRLTEALINQASVSARGADAMGLISLALGQINRSDKLLMQDLRQLTSAGVDVNGILGEMGYSLADVGKESISSQEFLLKFVETIERDLGGAALRQAGTLTGLANSLGDLGKKYLREFFGPFNEATGKMGGILGVVQPILQKFVDTLMDERVIKGVQTIGLLIGEGLTGSFSMLGNVLTNLVKSIQKPFNQAAHNAFSWGANIIIQLAQGIINAAGSILISAINFVAQILANWFAPGSPPAVAPEIDSWGQAAMGEFLHGFTEADFSVLKGIQQPLQAALQTMMQAGDIDAQGLADTYASITAGLAEALATGGDPSEIFAQIAEEAGAFGPELAELAERQFALAGGVEAVKQAEEDLAAARQAEENAGKAVMQLTQEYNDLLRSGADDATLQMKLEEINAAETAKDLAGEQADEAEGQLDIAKANLEVMEEQVRLQQELVNQLIELARLQAQAIPLDETTGGTTGGGGGTPGGGGLPPINLPDPGEAVQNFLDEVIAEIRAAAAQMFAPITEAWNRMLSGLVSAWQNLMTAFTASGLLEQLQSIWTNAAALAQIGLSILLEFIGTGLQTLAEIWNTHKDAVIGIWNSFWGLVASIAGGVFGLVISNIAQRLEEARLFFETNRQQISEIIQTFWDTYATIVDTYLGSILAFIQDQLDFLQGMWDTHGVEVLGLIDTTWDEISAVIFGVMEVVLDFVQGALEALQGFWDAHGGAVTTIVDFFLGVVSTAFQSWVSGVTAIVTAFFTLVAGFWQAHGDTIVGIVNMFLDLLLLAFQTVLGLVGLALEGFAALITGDWTTFTDTLQTLWETAWNAVSTVVTGIIGTISEAINGFIDGVVSAFTTPDWNGIGSDLMDGIAGGVTSAAGALQDAISSAIANAIAAAKKALGISSPSKVFAAFGANISYGLAEGIGDTQRAPLSALSDTISALVNPPLISQAAGNTTNYNSMNVSFQNNVGNGIDVAALDAHIISVIKSAFGGR